MSVFLKGSSQLQYQKELTKTGNPGNSRDNTGVVTKDPSILEHYPSMHQTAVKSLKIKAKRSLSMEAK